MSTLAISKARVLTSTLIIATVGLGMLLIPATSVSADPPTTPTLTVQDGLGSPSAAVAVGDNLNVSTTAPVTHVGQTGQRLVDSWDPAKASIDTSSIVHPEGWTEQYTTDGSTWSSVIPTDPTTISGVRSQGNVESDGYATGLQTSTATGTGSLVSGSAAFSGSSGGDGWDATATDIYVLNTWHHNGNYNLDCHLKDTGASCGAVYQASGYSTSMGASGSVVAGKFYSVVGESASGTYGVLCTDISAIPFTSCGYTPLATLGQTGYQWMGTQTLSGTKIYSTLRNGQLICFDIATGAACSGQPYAVAGFSGTVSNMGQFTISDSGYVFVTANKISCFVAATGAPCSGSWPVGSYSGAIHSAVPMRATDGTLTGVCMIRPAGDCFDLTGAAVPMPSALVTLLANDGVGQGSEVGIGSYDFSGTRQYWLDGSWGSPSSHPVCWDWSTGAACAGFVTTTDLGYVRYAIRLDPVNAHCAWTNGDNGVITSFDPLTGNPGCPSGDPTVVVSYTTVLPRMGCAETGRVRGYHDLTLSAPVGVSLTGLDVTVNDSGGNPVTGFTNLNPNSGGVLDLSALDPVITGTQPSITIVAAGSTFDDAAAIVASLRFDSDAPQMCLTLVSIQDCPTMSAGQSSTPAVPVSDVAINSSTVAIVSSVETPTPLSQTVTRTNMSNCLGTVSGIADRTYPGGPTPIVGATISLQGPGTTVVATATTASDGSYSFANIKPAAYTVHFGTLSLSRTVAATATATANFDIAVTTPTAGAISATTLQNTALSFAILPTVDATTTADLTTVQLFDPGTSTWGTSRTVAGEGTWTVVSGGNLHFVPLIGFTGVSTSVTYRFADGYGTVTAGASAHITVLTQLPTATAVHGSAYQGGSVSLTPHGVGPTVPLVAGSLRILDSSQTAVSSVVVAHVGTYTVNVTTGKVDFVPLSTFVGTSNVIYQVRDTLDRVAVATMTVRIVPITLSQPVMTVALNTTAHLTVAGAPSGSVLTVPASAPHATSVSIHGSTVTVVPNHGFSGAITVSVTSVHGGSTMTTPVRVQIRPTAVTRAFHDLTARGNTIVHWAPSGGALTYQVRVNGVLRCTTTAHTCGVALLLGPNARINVTAIGHNGVTSAVATAPYRMKSCVSLGAVFFSTASARLSPGASLTLASIARKIKAQGFTRGCLVGHTDSRGSEAANQTLSKHRVESASTYLHGRTPHTSYRLRFFGELAPISSNDTAAGRAANRRVEIGVF